MSWWYAVCVTLLMLYDSALAACPAPPVISNSKIDTQSDTNVKYSCKRGYQARGRTSATCTDGANWVFADNRRLECSAVSCGKPTPDKEHASYKETSFKFGDQISYICDVGYKQSADGVQGFNTIDCQASGIWTINNNFKCVAVTCAVLSDPANGKVANVVGTTGKYEYNYKYKYTCNSGFMSNGRQTVTVTCQASGKWTEENIECKVGTCLEPQAPANGFLKGSGNEIYAAREFRCFDNATMDGISKGYIIRYCQKDGQWTGSQPTCTVQCSMPATHENGVAEKVSNREYRMKCITGYQLQSGMLFETIMCQNTGQWSFNPAVCLKECSKPATHENGVAEKVSDREYRMKCITGYQLESGKLYKTITCEKTGHWSFNPAVCLKVSCGDLPKLPPVFELVSKSGTSYTIRCKDGYQLLGQSQNTITETCQNNGQWTQTNPKPSCIEATCDQEPKAPANGKIKKDPNQKKTYIITCNDDYVMTGFSKVTCVNKRWTPTTTICEKSDSSAGHVPLMIGLISGIASVFAVIVTAIIGCCLKRRMDLNHPKTVPSGHPEKCQIIDTDSDYDGDVIIMVITINTAEAGMGAITCKFRNPTGEHGDNVIKDNGDRIVSIIYTPDFKGTHAFAINFDGKPIPNGYFTKELLLMELDARNTGIWNRWHSTLPSSHPEKCRIIEGREQTTIVGEETVITINTAEAGKGAITCNIRDPNGVDRDIESKDNHDGTVSFFYTPDFKGTHAFAINFDGKPIPNGYFTKEVLESENDNTQELLLITTSF